MYLERTLHLTSRMQDDPNRERRLEVVAEARTWIGTPFKHQASIKGYGCDCLGLIRRIATDLNLCSVDPYGPEVEAYMYYGTTPNPEKFGEGVSRFLVEVSFKDVLHADIILFMSRVNPTHLGLITDNGMVHSYLKNKKVVEHGLNEMWFRHIKAFYRFPAFVSS